MRSAGHTADRLVARENLRALAGNAAVHRHKPASAHARAPVKQTLPADKLRLVQLHKHVQPRLQWRDVRGQLVPVQGHRGFHAQRVARAQSAGNQPEGLPGLQKRVPQLRGLLRLQVDFKAVLAGVAGAGYQRVRLRLKAVIPLRKRPFRLRRAQNLLRRGALQRDLRHAVRNVFKHDVARKMLRDPLHVLLPVRGVQHQHVIALAEFVYQKIVHRAAVFVAHRTVARLPVLHARKVVGQQAVQVAKRVRAPERGFAHVAHIKQPGLRAHGSVLGNHARRILDRQQVPRKWHNLPAQSHVRVIQRRFPFQISSLPIKNTEDAATDALCRFALCF